MVFGVDDGSFGYTLRLGVEFLFGFFSILLLLVHFLEQPGRVRNIGVEYQFGIGSKKPLFFLLQNLVFIYLLVYNLYGYTFSPKYLMVTADGIASIVRVITMIRTSHWPLSHMPAFYFYASHTRIFEPLLCHFVVQVSPQCLCKLCSLTTSIPLSETGIL
jgi:uncharacterized membrane protein YhhN